MSNCKWKGYATVSFGVVIVVALRFYCTGFKLYKPGVLFMGHRQTE